MRRTPTVLALAAAGLLVAACGSTVDGTATAAAGGSSPASSTAAAPTSSSGSSGSPSTSASAGSSGDLTALLLGQGDFPAGYEVDPVSADALSGLAGGIEGAIPGLTVSPPQCGQTNPYASLADVVGVTGVDVSSGVVGVEILGPGDGDALDQLSSTLAGCGSFSASFSVPGGASASVQVTLTPLQAPGADADAVFGYAGTSVTDAGTGSPITTTQSQLYGAVDGTIVGVALSSLSGTPVDGATLDGLFTAAVDKVRAG